MRNHTLIALCSLAIIFSGCSTQAYYISPMYGKSAKHYTLPMQKDSVRSAAYVNGTFGALSTNYNLRDEVDDFQGVIYNVHSLNHFNVYYGAEGGLGRYRVARIQYLPVPHYLDTARINSLAGNYFYGNFGFVSGIVVAIPVNDGKFEWRLPGLEFYFQKEFGDYTSFRKKLNKDSVSGLVTNNFLASMNISAGFAFATRSGEAGFKIMQTVILGKDYKDTQFGRPENGHLGHRYNHFSFALHITDRKWTYFLQSSLGSRIFGAQAGANYRLATGKNK